MNEYNVHGCIVETEGKNYIHLSQICPLFNLSSLLQDEEIQPELAPIIRVYCKDTYPWLPRNEYSLGKAEII